MLRTLSIQNYILIESLVIDFKKGFSTITGETGAGKSILLGALFLILGRRAEIITLKDKSKKCIVEGHFNIPAYNLKGFFSQYDLDYEDMTILRREVLPSGKSRAFINDTPVNLNILKELGTKLVDIHSQYQNLLLSDYCFQLRVVDIYGKNENLTSEYKEEYLEYKRINAELEQTINNANQAGSDLDYLRFQFDQLEKADLQENEQAEIEQELEILDHAEEIKTILNKASELLFLCDMNILDNLNNIIIDIERLKSFFPGSADISDRLNSCYIELKDISENLEIFSGDTEFDPGRKEIIRRRLDEIYTLLQKHNVSSTKDLIEVKNSFRSGIEKIGNYDTEVEDLKCKLSTQKEQLKDLSDKISGNRIRIFPELENKIVTMLKQLGMPNVRFKISHSVYEDFRENGIDNISFLFSANKKIELQELSRVASGGEISRFMLCIKSLISKALTIPTVIFDEIDAGVSGDIADKVGDIMLDISESMQVISVTHIPQIAGKGKYHYIVYKDESKEIAYTDIRLLSYEDRIVEIAKMLSGKELTDAAYENAKQLLKN